MNQSFFEYLEESLIKFNKFTLRKLHPLRYLFWEATLNCNFYCKHCGSNAGKKKFKGELNTKQIKQAFNDIASKHTAKDITIAVTGGEPLLRKDLFEVMTYASSLGFPWGVVTNASLITDRVIEKMKKNKMSTISISIDGIGKTHDDFRNTKGSYKKAITAVKKLVAANFLSVIQVTTCVHPKLLKELEKMYKIISKLKIHSWRIMNIDPIGRAEVNKKIQLNNKQLKEMLQFIKEKRYLSNFDITYGCAGYLGSEFEMKVRAVPFQCNTGISIGTILHNGDIFVCPNVPRIKKLIQGNVKKDSFSEVWDKKFKFFRDKNRTSCDQCQKCEKWERCLGGSFHLWDFKNNKPKLCHFEKLT